MIRTAILALLISCPWARFALAADLTGPARVIDGDTIAIQGQNIRLYGIDAPEIKQTCRLNGQPWSCGREAAGALRVRIGREPVVCEIRGTDRSKRTLAVCRVDGEDLNGWLVSVGLAVAYRRYAADYEAQEDEARAERKGLWAGEFVMPEAWRRSHRKVGQ